MFHVIKRNLSWLGCFELDEDSVATAAIFLAGGTQEAPADRFNEVPLKKMSQRSMVKCTCASLLSDKNK